MKKNTKKIKVLVLSLVYSAFLSCTCSSSSANYSESNEENIYIGNANEVKELYSPGGKYLAYVIDERDCIDPNMEIYNSYLITNHNDMKKIINMLLELEENDPTQWDRTYRSMLNEWIIHNMFGNLNMLENRSKSVDFNNADEEIYANVISSLLNGKFDEDFLQLEDDTRLKLIK